jgi:hypothetical protein
MVEMLICGGLLRLVASDVLAVRLRSTRLTSHPHLKHFNHAVVHPMPGATGTRQVKKLCF